MGRICLLMTLVASSVFAARYTWTGSAGGDWTTPGNWNDDAGVACTEAYPAAADDVAFFTVSASVAVPASFAGATVVSNGTLTASIADATRFSLAVWPNGKFVKAGAGELTVQPVPGRYPGAIEISAGTVKFAGNGVNAAPGMFGSLKVASGCRAEIVESPANERHGVAVRAEKNETPITDATADRAEFTAHASPFSVFESTWAARGADARDRWTFLVDDTTAFLKDLDMVRPSTYYSDSELTYFDLMARAVVLLPGVETLFATFSIDDYGIVYLDRAGWSGNQQGGTVSVGTQQPGRGWHTVDVAYHERAGSHFCGMKILKGALGTTRSFTKDLLWKGVCFTDLDLAAGATLAVADGQAVAFACGKNMTLQGAVTGGSDTVFSLMNGSLALDAARFAGFSGTVEVTKFARLALASIPAAPTFSVEGAGALDSATAALVDGFAGTVEVDAGQTITNIWGTAVKFVGKGTVVTPTEADFSTYEGTVVLADGLQTAPSAATGRGVAGYVLEDGAKMTVDLESLSRGAERPLDDWSVEGAWKMLPKQNTPRDYLAGPGLYVTNNNVLVLTDDGGSQRNTAILTNHLFGIDDEWRVSYTFRAEMLRRWPSEVRAEGFSVFLSTTNATPNYGQGGWSSGSYGFYLYQYRSSGTQGLCWIVNGQYVIPDYKESLMGISLEKPIDMELSCVAGLFTATFRQNGKSFTCSHDFSDAFSGGTRRWLGFGGGTGWWGEVKGAVEGGSTSDVYLYQTVSNFTGTIRRGTDIQTCTVPFDEDHWYLRSTMSFLEDGGLLALKLDHADGTALCREAIPPRQAFVVEFDQELVSLTGGWAEGLSVFFRPNTNMTVFTTSYAGTGSPSLALRHYYWENKINWDVDNNNTERNSVAANNTGMPKSLGTNHYVIQYDGKGTFTATVSRGSVSYTMTKYYPAVLEWDAIHLGFQAAGAGWVAYVVTHIHNLSLIKKVNSDVQFGPTLEAAADASVALAFANFDPDLAAKSETLKVVTLRAGSTLSVGSDTTVKGSFVGFDRLETDGAATLAIASGSKAELAEFAWGGPLTVTGSWTAPEPLVIRVDTTRLPQSGPAILADFSSATYQGEGTPSFTATSLDGTPIPGRYRLSVDNGIVRLTQGGVTIYLR